MLQIMQLWGLTRLIDPVQKNVHFAQIFMLTNEVTGIVYSFIDLNLDIYFRSYGCTKS